MCVMHKPLHTFKFVQRMIKLIQILNYQFTNIASLGFKPTSFCLHKYTHYWALTHSNEYLQRPHIPEARLKMPSPSVFRYVGIQSQTPWLLALTLLEVRTLRHRSSCPSSPRLSHMCHRYPPSFAEMRLMNRTHNHTTTQRYPEDGLRETPHSYTELPL